MGELFWGGIMPYDQPLKKGCPTNGYRTYNPTEMMENWRGNCRKDPEAHGLRNCAEISMLFAVPSSQRPGGTPLSGRRAPRCLMMWWGGMLWRVEPLERGQVRRMKN